MSISENINRLLKSDDLRTTADTAVDYAISRGVLSRTKDEPGSSEVYSLKRIIFETLDDLQSIEILRKQELQVVQHVSFTLVPSPVPKDLFDQALSVQKDFGMLMHLVSRDHAFLKESYQSVLDTDPFTKKLFEIYEAVQHLNKDRIHFAILRSDYMFNTRSNNVPCLKQIEINMIASSFIGIGTDAMVSVHSHVLRTNKLGALLDHLPQNTALKDIATGLIDAWKAYKNPNAILVFVIAEKEQNIFDQRALEFKINELDADVSIYRFTLTDFRTARIDERDRLFISGREVGLLYFRAGYVPNDYPSDKEWDARMLIEKSRAVKCPSVAYQLVGAKKLQQILAQDGVVEKYIKDPAAVKRIRDTFVKFHGLEMNEQGDEAVSLLLQNSDNFVLKPQLEGGGNNLYGKDIISKLTEVGKDKRRCSFIGMEKIRPMSFQTVILRPKAGSDQYKLVEGVAELGVYGILIVDGDKIVQNSRAGHLLRTKASYHEDGGVAAGVAVLDSPLLIED